MTNLFSEPGNRRNLLASAFSWIGTPWCANSEAKGQFGGVACHNLPIQIYKECAALPFSFPRIIGDPCATRHSKISVMVETIAKSTYFEEIEKKDMLPGDLLGIRIYACIDHLGLLVEDGNFIHVLMHKKTDLDPAGVPPWQQRIEKVWRLK